MTYLSRLAQRISQQRAPILIILSVVALALLQPLLVSAKPAGRDLGQLAEIAQSTASLQATQEADEDDAEANATETPTRPATQTPAANQTNIALPTAGATTAPSVDAGNLLSFSWQGENTVPAQELGNVAPPLQAEVLQGDFQVSFVPLQAATANEGTLRILPDPASTDLGTIRLGVTLNQDLSVGETLRLRLSARAYGPDATARLVIADDFGSSSVPLAGLNWQEYQVTRAIDSDATTVELFLEWANVPANGWLEMRNLSLAPLTPAQAATLSPTDTPTRVGEATSPTPRPPTSTPTPTAAAIVLATATPVLDTDVIAVAPTEAITVTDAIAVAPTKAVTVTDLLPTPTPTYIVVTSTSTPVDVLEEATRAAQATEWARILGPATATPPNLATPTPTSTPFVIVLVKTPTPENAATAIHISVVSTAMAFTTGTPTPFPPEATVEIATDVPPPPTPEPPPTAIPTPIYVLLADIPTPAPAATIEVPAPLHNKIIFLTDYYQQPWAPNAMIINPDGSDPALMVSNTFYYIANADEQWSADRRFHVFSKPEAGGAAHNAGNWQLFWDDIFYESYGHQLTYFGAGVAWAGAFSPDGETVALVSSESGNDEIWITERQTWPATQLTKNEWEWDHHPSFSPDGSEIVFSSNRVGGRRQLWMMTRGGGDQRQLTNFTFEAWDPVWIKYVEGEAEPTAVPAEAIDAEAADAEAVEAAGNGK